MPTVMVTFVHCPCNICHSNICPYQEYLIYYWPNFDQTFEPNIFGALDFLDKNFLRPKFLVTQFFFVSQKTIGTKILLNPTLFFSLIISGFDILDLNISGPEFVGKQNFFGSQMFGDPNFFCTKIFLGQKFFGTQIGLTQNFHGSKIFFGPNISKSQNK